MFGISKSQREKRGAGFCKATSNSLLFLETFKKLRFSSVRNSFNQTDQKNAKIITWHPVLFLTFSLYATLKQAFSCCECRFTVDYLLCRLEKNDCKSMYFSLITQNIVKEPPTNSPLPRSLRPCPLGWGFKAKSWWIDSAVAKFIAFGHTFAMKIIFSPQKRFSSP